MADNYNVSAGGLSIRLIASLKFPVGFNITALASDADPLDFPEVTIGEAELNLNGNLVSSKTPNPYNVTLNVIPGSDDDRNLDVLFQANAPRRFAQMDDITMIVTYPDGSVRTALRGICVSYNPGKGVGANGKMKSRPYKFVFADIIGN